MLVNLVQTTTRDGVRLDGTLQRPADQAGLGLGVDGVCLVHGTGGNFYSSTLFDSLAERLLGLGCAVLRVNTRGHDGISTAMTARGGRRLGAAYEALDECRHDLAAWTDWLREQTGPRVVLVGHSSGAVKCLYALAQEPQIGAAGVIAISPPRLSYSWFCASPEGAGFLEGYAEAERQVTAGQPGALLEVKLPLPMVITAAGYLEKYGPDERYNYVQLVRGLPCPALVTFGAIEAEHSMAFRGAAEALAELGRPPDRLAVETIPGADHFYTDRRGELAERVGAWLRGTFR